jgi:hypothetical protein
MAPRNRSIVFSANKGTGGRFGATWGGHVATVGGAHCADQTGPGDCAPFTVHRVNLEGGRFNQGVEGSYWSPWFKDYLADVFDDLDTFYHLDGLDGDLPDGEYAARAAARTNPSRPYIDVPIAVLELKDLIPLIRDRGREYFRGNRVNQAAQANLFYQFAIRPMVNDLVNTLGLQTSVDKRVQEIKRLKSKNGLRRTVGLGSYSKTDTVNLVYQSVGTYMVGTFSVKTMVGVRGHCRWLPDVESDHLLTPESMRALARRAVLGLTVDASTVWELIPWSWLVDWCTNFGDFLSANRNIIPAVLSGVHIMRHTRTEWTMQGGAFDDIVIDGVRLMRESKSRNPSFVSPVAHFPFLNGTQVGILASLTASRRTYAS